MNIWTYLNCQEKWGHEGSLRALQMETQSCYICYVLLEVSSHYVHLCPHVLARTLWRPMSASSSSPAWISRDSLAVVQPASLLAVFRAFKRRVLASYWAILDIFRHWGTTKSHMESNRLLMQCKWVRRHWILEYISQSGAWLILSYTDVVHKNILWRTGT